MLKYIVLTIVVLKYMKYIRKNGYGPEINWILNRKQLLIFNFIGNIKLRALNFGYVMGVDMTIMYINFQMNLWVSLKVMVQLV